MEKGDASTSNGPSVTVRAIRLAPTTARIEAPIRTPRHWSPIPRMRWGPALPTVSAPTSTPSAMPLPRPNHPAIAFMPLGYTPARASPVRNLSPYASETLSTDMRITAALAAAATVAAMTKSRREGTESAIPVVAIATAPITKPI